MNYRRAVGALVGVLLGVSAAGQGPIALHMAQAPTPYTDYTAGPIRLQVLATDPAGQPPAFAYRLELANDTVGASLDPQTGAFVWQPRYYHEGRSHRFEARLVCDNCPTVAPLPFTVVVADIATEPSLVRPRLLSLAPNQSRDVALELDDPSGQPCDIVSATSSLPTVVVARAGAPRTLRIRTSATASGSGKLQLTLRNQADGATTEVDLPLVLEAVQYKPEFTSSQTTYRTTEGSTLRIEAPATDRNLDPILYGWEEVEALATEATFALIDPERGTYQFTAGNLGDADVRIARYRLTASDGFAPAEKLITIEVRRTISRNTEQLRRAAFTALVADYRALIDTCQASLYGTQRMIQRRNWYNKGVDIGLFGITLGSALATNLANPTTNLPKVSSILSAVGAGLVALIKVNLVTEVTLQNTTQALQAELITAQKRLEILYGGERLGGFVLGSSYTQVMDDYQILLEAARTRYHLAFGNLLVEPRIQKVIRWRDARLSQGAR
ncbi:MAG: hypothetical protein SFY70_00540 [Bacteroidia bacterium]|nr:hypothetical protein [Bacteroidia bacterium]